MEAMKTYGLSVVAAVAGRTPSTVNAWVNKAVLTPSVGGAGGRGRHRTFLFPDLVEARVVAEFHQLGLPPDMLRQAVATLRLSQLHLSNRSDAIGKEMWAAWNRLIRPAERRACDAAFLICSPRLQGGYEMQVSAERKDTASSALELQDPARLGSAFIVVNVRHAIEDVELATGDDWVSSLTWLPDQVGMRGNE